MNGAHQLVHALLAQGVDTCFTNPGTSEMHFVSALDRIEGMRCVLGLFEGVVTGAADGYWRMARKPAATLLHLGPGLANGLANLHNARKARSGVVNVVGEHALAHLALDAPLTSDIEALARPMSHWVRTVRSPQEVAGAARDAARAARQAPGQVATLVLPADCAWGEAGPMPGAPGSPGPGKAPAQVDAARIAAAAALLREPGPTLLLLGGDACLEPALELAGRIQAATGCALMSAFYVARLQRGAGRVNLARVPYAVDAAVAALAPYRRILLVGADEPVSFFAYPGKPGRQAAEGCHVMRLADPGEDACQALEALADALGARQHKAAGIAAPLSDTGLPEGRITPEALARLLSVLLPAQSVVIDESVSSGRALGPATAQAAPHDWLAVMGGSIGWGLPAAVGAAIGAPGRRVLALEGDGSAMYTIQALWTMAREGLPVTVVILANQAYRILLGEYAGVGAGEPGPKARRMLQLDAPTLDFVSIARGMGVEAARVQDCAGLAHHLRRALAAEGPYLVEAQL